MPFRPSHPRQRFVDLCEVEAFGSKSFPGPPAIVVELRVLRVEDDFQKLLVSGYPTHIFGWAGPFTAEAEHRNGFGR